MDRFLGVPYPVRKTPQGFLYSQGGVDQIKSDLLCLLLTNPGERVMNPAFGTPLRTLLFDPNDRTLQLKAKNMVLNSIRRWEPRIAVRQVDVSARADGSLDPGEDAASREHILFVRILFVDPGNMREVQELVLEVPLASGA